MFIKGWSELSSNSQLTQLKDVTPTNFQFPTRYPCIICYQRCQEPVSCIRCNQIMCQKHTDKLKNKCPNCRLNPFVFKKDEFLRKLIENEVQKERDFLISKATFTCLVEGCNFQGKYHKMDIHRRRQHRNEEIKDILFPQEREKKKRKEIIEKLFLKLLMKKRQQIQLAKRAKQIFDGSNKKLKASQIFKMLCHIASCQNEKCKYVHILKDMSYIGDLDKNFSQCIIARNFLTFFDN